MTLHSIVLFLHVGAALGMAATIGVLSTYTLLLARASSLAEARALYDMANRISIIPKMLAPTLVITGARLAYERQGVSEPWVIAGIVILALLTITGAAILQPRVRDAVGDAERAGDVTLIARRLADPWLAWVVSMRAALFVLVIFLMTTKPGAHVTLGASIAAVAVATAASQLRHHRSLAHA